MNNWQTVRLGDVCEKGSSNIAQNEIAENNGDYPIYGAAGFIKNVDFYKQDKPYIGIVKDGAGVGRVSLHPAKSSLIGTMQYIFPKENVDIKFLAEFLKYQNLSRFYTGATIPHIYFKDYQDIPLKLPSLQVQKQISAILNKCTEIIEKNKQMLEKYDKLIKYDVYQVLLAYWNETMNDDVLLVIQDELGYKLAKVTDDIKEEPKESKKSKKDSAKEKKPKEPKVIGWEGRLIPKQIVLDAFFEAEQKAIEEAEEKLNQTESELEEFVEENCVDDAEDDELSQESEILKKCKAYEASIKSQKKTIADLKKKLDENCRKRYDTFTDSEITDLLVNRKWYKTIDQGIQNLYVTVANHLTKRIVELYERYENTLPELTAKLAEEEKEVAAHLAQMGFKL